MTLGDLQGLTPMCKPIVYYIWCSCAAVEKISTDTARRAVPLRYLNRYNVSVVRDGGPW